MAFSQPSFGTFSGFGAQPYFGAYPSFGAQQQYFNAYPAAFGQGMPGAQMYGFGYPAQAAKPAVDVSALNKLNAYVDEVKESLRKIQATPHYIVVERVHDIKQLCESIASAHASYLVGECVLDLEPLVQCVRYQITDLQQYAPPTSFPGAPRSLDDIEYQLLLMDRQIDKLLLHARKGAHVNVAGYAASIGGNQQTAWQTRKQITVSVSCKPSSAAPPKWQLVYE